MLKSLWMWYFRSFRMLQKLIFSGIKGKMLKKSICCRRDCYIAITGSIG